MKGEGKKHGVCVLCVLEVLGQGEEPPAAHIGQGQEEDIITAGALLKALKHNVALAMGSGPAFCSNRLRFLYSSAADT